MTITKMIETNEIRIVSGEGVLGASEPYTGKRTMRAIKMRLTRERCGGDRWARAVVFSYAAEYGDVFVDVVTGEYC